MLWPRSTDRCKYGQYSDSKNLITVGEGKFGKTGLAFYRAMPVALKQFNEGVSQAEVEHEANVTLFAHLIRPNLSCLYYNSNSFFGRNDSTDFYYFFESFCKDLVSNISRYLFIYCFYHAAVEKAHLLKVFFWLVFPLYRMGMMQRKFPRTARRE